MAVVATSIAIFLVALVVAAPALTRTGPRSYDVGITESAGAGDSFGGRSSIRPLVNVYVYKNGELVAFAHNIITNEGMRYLKNAVHFGNASGVARYIALSTNGATPAYTDTVCPSEITTGGLERVAGSVTTILGPLDGDVTVRVEHTFTATATVSNVQKACLLTAATEGVLYAEATFTAVNLEPNDQLTIRWEFSYTN